MSAGRYSGWIRQAYHTAQYSHICVLHTISGGFSSCTPAVLELCMAAYDRWLIKQPREEA